MVKKTWERFILYRRKNYHYPKGKKGKDIPVTGRGDP
jgi:hypothetical protein